MIFMLFPYNRKIPKKKIYAYLPTLKNIEMFPETRHLFYLFFIFFWPYYVLLDTNKLQIRKLGLVKLK